MSALATGDKTQTAWLFVFAAWIVALGASLGALFIGEVMGQTPCVLCWHQRAFMFPLAVILAVASYRADVVAWVYGLPLAAIGWLIAAYHTLLYYRLVPETLEPCAETGPSCSDAAMTILGGMPIPVLSLAAFTIVAGLLIATIQRKSFS